MILSYFKHFLVFNSIVSGCVLISAFASLGGASVSTVTSAVGLKICSTAAGNKKCKSIVK